MYRATDSVFIFLSLNSLKLCPWFLWENLCFWDAAFEFKTFSCNNFLQNYWSHYEMKVKAKMKKQEIVQWKKIKLLFVKVKIFSKTGVTGKNVCYLFGSCFILDPCASFSLATGNDRPSAHAWLALMLCHYCSQDFSVVIYSAFFISLKCWQRIISSKTQWNVLNATPVSTFWWSKLFLIKTIFWIVWLKNNFHCVHFGMMTKPPVQI